MGYQVLIETMSTGKPREVVSVVIPEGFTLNKIADRLEENNVCSRTDFFTAANNMSYDYEFLKDLPTTDTGPAKSAPQDPLAPPGIKLLPVPYLF